MEDLDAEQRKKYCPIRMLKMWDSGFVREVRDLALSNIPRYADHWTPEQFAASEALSARMNAFIDKLAQKHDRELRSKD